MITGIQRTGLVIVLLLLGGWLSGCVSETSKVPAAPPSRPSPSKPQTPAGDPPGNYRALALSGDYRGYPAVEAFIDDLVARYGFTRSYLLGLLSSAERKSWTIEYMNREKPTGKQKPGGWTRYRAKFLDSKHIEAGTQFGRRYQRALSRAEATFGVPAEVILGILGVETLYGANLGQHRILDALTTLAFDYPRRADYFKEELAHLLIMAREEGFDPARPRGSFAGAMGLGQFMPGSFLKYAIDFNGDGRRDLWDPEDAIGSIAHYFKSFGWTPGGAVVVAAEGRPDALALKDGFDTRYTPKDLSAAGLRPLGPLPRGDTQLSLLKLSTVSGDELRLGLPNFYVITRYNHSTYYAMAVYELGQAVGRRLAESRP